MSQSQCGRSPSQAGYPIVAMVGHYPPSLIGRGPIPDRKLSTTVGCPKWSYLVLALFRGVIPESGQVAHVLLTRSPLIPGQALDHRSTCMC